MSKFSNTPLDYKKAVLWLKLMKLDGSIQNEQSVDGFTVVALANHLWEKHSYKDINPLEYMVGRTISSAVKMRDVDYVNDVGYLRLTFTDGTIAFIVGSYTCNTWEVRDEYGTYIEAFISDKPDELLNDYYSVDLE